MLGNHPSTVTPQKSLLRQRAGNAYRRVAAATEGLNLWTKNTMQGIDQEIEDSPKNAEKSAADT